MDENLPQYKVLAKGERPPSALGIPDDSPSVGAVSSFVRLGAPGDTVSCEQVRQAAFPEN
jgi:hypothetical protein